MRDAGDAGRATRLKRAVLLLFACACVAGFVRLGFWQLARAHEKELLLGYSQEVLVDRHLVPLAPLVNAPEPGGQAPWTDFHWSVGGGHFLPLPAVLLDNQSRDGHPGVRVYRVFQPDGARRALLVELGWRPLPPDRSLPAEPAISGPRTLSGLFAAPPSAGLTLGMAALQPQRDGTLLAMRLEPARIASTLGLRNGISGRVLRLDPALPIGYARDLDVLAGAMPPERHRGYAVQWFGLAAGLAIASLVVALRRSPRKESDA